jgi:KDO2-lipid IV(A) lauroyltransferase
MTGRTRRTIPLWQSAPLRALIFLAGLAVTPLPRRWELTLGALLGRLALHLAPTRRKIAQDNIRHCLPELDGAARERLLKENFEHYGILALELLHMFSPFPGHYREYVRRVARLEGFHHWRRADSKGKGVLFVSAHLANWELMTAAGAMAGIPLTMVTRHLKPEWLHLLIDAARRSVKVKAAYLPDTLTAILRSLRKGESLGFVLDQYAHPPVGVKVPFFGVEVDTLGAVPPLSLRYGTPIVPVRQIRDKNGFVRILIEPELDLGDAKENAIQGTAVLAAMVEHWIRANPDQWLWAHRRFKYVEWPSDAVRKA